MDIVDINKVLDDLELNEEEQHSKLSKPTAHSDGSIKQQQQYVPYKYGPTTATAITGQSNTVGPTVPGAVTPSVPNRMTKTNFVKVSNVFNSLNEYMNAGIEAVKKPEETCTLDHAQPIGTTSTKNTLYSMPPIANFVNSKTEQTTNNYLNTIESAGPSANFAGAQYDSVITGNVAAAATVTAHETMKVSSDGKEDSSIDPPSYEESQSMLKSSNNTMTELSDSVVADGSDGQTTTESESDGMDSESGEEDDTGDDDQYPTDTRNDEKMINDSAADNRTELSSSVIPPTTLSLAITATHTDETTHTDTALPDTVNSNKSSEIFEDNDELNHNENKLTNSMVVDNDGAAQPVVAHVVITGPTLDEPQPNEELSRNADDNNAQPADEKMDLMPNDRFIKPIAITFETAATMDDVSDTELESYLQELEESCGNLEDLEDGSMGAISATAIATTKVKSDSIKSANGSMMLRSDENDTEPYDGIYNIDHTIGSASDINQMVARDDRNADSFSQASTVEFGEVNTTNLSNEQLPCSEQICVPATTDAAAEASIVKSTVDAVPIDPEPTSEMRNEHLRETIEIHSNHNDGNGCVEPIVNTAIGSECNESAQRQEPCSSELCSGQSQNECPECEIDQQIMSAVKRPNSLNLQNCNSTLVATATATAATVASQSDQIASNALFSSDDNAGNTPPASGLFLSSSISSDDSNIGPTDNNQLMHQLENNQSNIDSESANESNVSENYSNSNPSTPAHLANSANISIHQLGKMAPYWVPDNMTVFCMQCNQKFSFIKRRHHCRACGLVLCSACCSLKARLEYMGDVEARICVQCDILLRDPNRNASTRQTNEASASVINSPYGEMPSPAGRSPNPNNPMEYCSVIPPHEQVTTSTSAAPISVLVPMVGVLKREGSAPKSQRKEKNVMFSDGIRPGCDLTDLDNSWDTRPQSRNGELSSPSGGSESKSTSKSKMANNLKLPALDPKTNSYIPPSTPTNSMPTDSRLPPICVSTRTSFEFKYAEVTNNEQLIERLQTQQLKFMIQRNFYVLVKIVKLVCCINKAVINFTTQGMHLVGQDEIVILLELDASNQLPKDIFIHLNEIYRDADKGQAIAELGFSMASSTPFLGSKEHGGFLFIRPTFQCTQNIIIPENPYLIGILIHRWEVPWAKIFPLRLMLRLGALHRYYPSPHLSVRGRNSVYAEIAQTIINILADFRTYSFTIPTIRGMYIHMEDKRTNVLIPRNRYDQVMKALDDSSDHIFALAGNFSEMADGHLVCVQNTESGCAETHAYSTQAINIQGKPRKVTGASFLVLNGALKTTTGLCGKCSIVEDGLMVQILPKKMEATKQALKTMKNIDIVCGPINGDDSQTEIVAIQWVENDVNFNIGVISSIDKKRMDGVPSIRVHHALDYANSNHIIRWTEVFILKSDDESAHGKDPIHDVDISKLSEQIARSASLALKSFLDLLATNGMKKIAIRATLDQDQVCYEAGSNYDKLAPLYMNALDNELIPTLHRQATNLQLDQTICLELVFHIMDV